MATRQEFVQGVEEVYKNHGVYIGCGNGEQTEKLTVGQIHAMELAYPDSAHNKNTARDLRFIAKCYEDGLDMSKSRACDCSGLAVYVLRKIGAIDSKKDYSAAMFQSVSKPVTLKALVAGDLVFNKTEKASHVGVYVGDNMVIESKGRDDGVVRRKLSAGKWVIGGRLPADWFEEDIPVLERELYYREGDLMKGEDVRQCQERLALAGYTCGTIDGVFGKKTKVAVQAFQLDNGLTADGIVGRKTAEALGFRWEG
jgi:hypothetical protein